LAVVHALTVWYCYLEGRKSVVVTDHNPLVYLQTQPTLTRRQAKWAEYLQKFDFEWRYRPGSTNPTDALSRLPGVTMEVSKETVEDMLLPLQLRSSIKKRHPLQPGVESEGRVKAKAATLLQRCHAGYNEDPWFKEHEHELGDKDEDGVYRWRGCVRVPHVGTLRQDILSRLHDSPYGGHLGARRTLEQAQRLFTWPTLAQDVDTFVKGCHTC